MNPINNVSAGNGVYKLQSTNAAARPSEAAPTPVARSADRVELSGVQNFLQVLRSNDIRADKVAQVRAQIEAGTYETDEKLNIAADRLLEDLN